ncbi:MAG: class I SAM-dependent methyltransferase [Pseudobdellovibrionaceae bacterium]
MQSHSSRIIDMANTTRCRVINLEYGEALSPQENCPSCDTRLTAVCVMLDSKAMTKARIGLCESCGYMGYMDRPSQQKIAHFYNSEWDQIAIKSPKEILNSFQLIEVGYKASRFNVLSAILDLGLSKDDLICEIGCGYGEILRNLQMKGFSKLYGTEHSQHRAQNVSEAFGIDIIWGEFEGEKVQGKLQNIGKFKLIYSNHVLEHTYCPADVIKSAAKIQDENDYLLLCMPNNQGENINGIIHFLPHLHSFSAESLEALLKRNGYILEKNLSFDSFNLIFLAKRKKNSHEFSNKIPHNEFYLNDCLNRIQKNSVLQNITQTGVFEIFWSNGGANPDHSVVKKATWWSLKKVFRYIRSRYLKRFSNGEFFLFETKTQRFTDVKDYPLEIQFSGPIKVLLK